MHEDETKEEHESFGLVGLYRTTGCSNLFGSSIQHGNYITLRVNRASRVRNMSEYWIHSREPIVEIALSANQFATLLTSMNVGDGVPCTIKYVGNKRMTDPPSVEQRTIFEKEFMRDVDKATQHAREAISKVAETFAQKAAIGKADRAEILGKISQVMRDLTDSIPFIQSQFNEAMDKTVSEARSEVDSFIECKIHSLGVEALNNEVKAAFTFTRESPSLMLEEKK